jgi:hypothetical protein
VRPISACFWRGASTRRPPRRRCRGRGRDAIWRDPEKGVMTIRRIVVAL